MRSVILYRDDPKYIAAVQEIETKNEIDKRRKATYPQTNYCSCVDYAKKLTGYVGRIGDARNWPVNSLFPVIGGVVVQSPNHVMVITGFEGNKMILDEANYVDCERTVGRRLRIDDPSIIGFWVRR